MKKTTKILAFAATAAVAFTAGCGSEDTAPTTAADTIVVSSAWTKAAESGMTGSFAELENTGDQDVQVVAVSSPVSSRSELHEMAPGADGGMAMRQMDGGLTIPAGGEHSLAPGADHLMLMDLLEPVTPRHRDRADPHVQRWVVDGIHLAGTRFRRWSGEVRAEHSRRRESRWLS